MGVIAMWAICALFSTSSFLLGRCLHILLRPVCPQSTGTISRPSTQRSLHGARAQSFLLDFFLQRLLDLQPLFPTLATRKGRRVWLASVEFQQCREDPELWEAMRRFLTLSPWTLTWSRTSRLESPASDPPLDV